LPRLARTSPNWDERPADTAIDLLVLHYTGMVSAAAALDRLCDPAAKVSAHYLVDEDGTITALVADAARAWHAGVSWWQGRGALNDVSLGIELVNPGHEWGYRPFPERQMAAAVELCRELVGRWRIPAGRVVGHSDIAPTRKEDPGELFDWQHLAQAGIGWWPETGEMRVPDAAAAQLALARIGYPGPAQGVPFDAALRAFQRRYRPSRCDGRLDAETMGRVEAVAGLCEPPGSTT
jgi:N-acetylmuramoyl-L-alanine amidase